MSELLDVIKHQRKLLATLKSGEGIKECNRATHEQMRNHFRWIEIYINRAAEELPKIETGKDMEFVKLLLQASEMRLQIAFYMPYIMRGEKSLADVTKERRKSWPELRVWILQQPISVKPDDLFCLLPTKSEVEFYDFEREGDRVYNQAGKSIGKKRFLNLVSEVRHPRPPG